MEAEEIRVEEYLEKITKLEEKAKKAEFKGQLDKSIEIAQKMLAKGKNAEEVAELTGLALEEISKLS